MYAIRSYYAHNDWPSNSNDFVVTPASSKKVGRKSNSEILIFDRRAFILPGKLINVKFHFNHIVPGQ